MACSRVSVVVGAVVDDKGLVLMTRRAAAGTRPDMWELPGGVVENGESHSEALHREFVEELGVKISVGACIDNATLQVERDYCIFLYRARIVDGTPAPLVASGLEWVDLDVAIVRRPLVPSTYLFYRTLRDSIARGGVCG